MKRHARGVLLMMLAVLSGLAAPSLALAQDVDFGDDTSSWANDGECDDPRFVGTGMAQELEDADILKDATDCRTLFDAGSITLAEGDAEIPASTATAAAAATEIDFGDDTSEWANDGECDDPRFAGTGMAAELEDADLSRDATDCRTLFEAGEIALASHDDTVPQDTAAIDFGDNSSEWARDDECDDPRFTGSAMAGTLEDINIGKDAADCEAAFNAGTVTLAENGSDSTGGSSTVSGDMLAAIASRIDFGDDSSEYAEDGECDDPDFAGAAMAMELLDENRLADATDCRAAFLEGTITLKAAPQPVAFDYGSDYSAYANDGECDDWRFTGAGMAKKLFLEDVMADASDCQALEQSGEIIIKNVYQPSYALNGPYDSSGIDFGDNASTYANDDICDDPRFEGPGSATTLLDSDRMADANDCKAAYEAGTIMLRDGEA